MRPGKESVVEESGGALGEKGWWISEDRRRMGEAVLQGDVKAQVWMGIGYGKPLPTQNSGIRPALLSARADSGQWLPSAVLPLDDVGSSGIRIRYPLLCAPFFWLSNAGE